jgi:putative NADH-flavin reductase
MNHKSVLIIGATGRTGTYLIKRLAKGQTGDESNAPSIFAMCRDPSKISVDAKACCTGVVRGNARDAKDIEHALKASNADLVIVAIGNGDSVKKNDIRTASAKALVSILTKSEHRHVRVLVVSSSGAGGSRIKVGLGIGKFIEFHLRHVLHDHDGQEEAFLSAMKNRTLIVRPTALHDNRATGKVVTFDDDDKCPTLETDRADLADWIAVESIFGADALMKFGAKPINITCVK